MTALKLLAIFIALVILAAVPIIARRRPRAIVRVGAELIPASRIEGLYRHDLQATRWLERVLQQDDALVILSDEDRAEAERLVKAFYDDKGD